ncbi:MAG TPA: HEAT repeat domain-containing protein [Terriglobales bacterium]|nr:HEAT repeat domain-containing protein [Terriglobales bacterium]
MSGKPDEVLFTFSIRRHRLQMAIAAACIVIFIAILGVSSGVAQAAWHYLTGHNASVTGPVLPATHSKYSEHETEYILSRPPQEQAERLLQAAVNHDEGATDVIEKLAPGWHGHLARTESLTTFENAAMAANDVRVRAAAIEVRLAVFDLEKKPETVSRLIKEVEIDPSRRARNANLLGMLANRGVQAERVREQLLTWVRDPEPRVRTAAVLALAMIASDDSVADLLRIIRDHPDPQMRAQAGHSIARTGMLTQEQRWRAVPDLIQLSARLTDSDRHDVFDSLREITAQTDLQDETWAWQAWWDQRLNQPKPETPDTDRR